MRRLKIPDGARGNYCSHNLLLSIGFLVLLLERAFFLLQMQWPIITPDTPSYFQFTLWNNQRLYTVPALYSLIQNHQAIVVTNSLLGICAWILFLKSLLVFLIQKSSQLTVSIFLIWLTLASSTPVFTMDFYLMSESINITLSIALFALVLIFINNPSKAKLLMIAICFILWIGAKQAHALTTPVSLTLLSVFLYQYRTIIGSRFLMVVLSAQATASILIFVQIFGDTATSTWNVVAVVYYVMEKNSDWIQWFYANGWPRNYINLEPNGMPNIMEAIGDSPTGNWIRQFGISTYLDFLIHHPHYALLASYFMPLIGGAVFSWQDTVGAALLYGSRQQSEIVKTNEFNILNSWWFETSKSSLVALILLAIVFLTCIWFLKTRILKRSSIMQLTASVSFLLFYLARGIYEWLLAPGDRQRIWIEHGVMVRVSVLGILLFLATSSESFSRRAKK